MRCPTEWAFTSTRQYGNPFVDVELDVIARDAEGAEFRMPAFWTGSQTWRVRYAPAQPGTHTWRSLCSDAGNSGLHGSAAPSTQFRTTVAILFSGMARCAFQAITAISSTRTARLSSG